ncbi:uncharacterized protein LOC143918549 [Arctopsyche grandis]|uniref:uncharacterized protein LOC143918549 n=1 Tax=Arctopsyche grandis TaxID=121162 RepID=UPI00406D8719
MGFNWWDAFLLAICFVVIFSAYGYWESGYYKRRGIKNLPFDFLIVGNVLKNLIGKEHLMDAIYKVYNAFPNEKYVGFVAANRGVIMLKDLEIIKKATIKDFENFPSHSTNIDASFDPILGRYLLFITGDEWKDMRATLSPAFTSSKLRNMISLVDETGKQIVDFISGKINEPDNKERGLIEVEMGDVLSRYTNDVLASTVYGVTVNSLNERHNEFYNMGMKTYEVTGIQLLKLIVYFSFPFLIRISGVQYFKKKFSDFFRNLVLGTMKYREENGITRPDMIQMIMEARKGSLKYDVPHNESNDAGFATAVESAIGKQTNKREWTENDILAQAVLFFIAGYETTKTLLSFAIHELTVNPDVQKRLQIEIDELIAENGDAFDYSDLIKMKYMDMVVCEALRKWPPAPATDRKCIRSFNLPPPNNSTNKEFTIQAGEVVLIPIHAIHHDPQYYPDPEKFDPERFSTENKANINPLSFLPFGVGPRNCIGSRYALMITKCIIFRLLSKFDLVMTAKTQNPIEIKSNSVSLIPKNGIWAGLKPRNDADFKCILEAFVSLPFCTLRKLNKDSFINHSSYLFNCKQTCGGRYPERPVFYKGVFHTISRDSVRSTGEMAFNWWDAFLLAIGFVVIFSAYGYWESGYFKRRGIKNIPFDFPIVGNMFEQLIGKEHLMDVIFKVYNAFPNEKCTPLYCERYTYCCIYVMGDCCRMWRDLFFDAINRIEKRFAALELLLQSSASRGDVPHLSVSPVANAATVNGGSSQKKRKRKGRKSDGATNPPFVPSAPRVNMRRLSLSRDGGKSVYGLLAATPSNKQLPLRRRNFEVGTAVSSSITAARRLIHIHVWKLSLDTSCDAVRTHVRAICGGVDDIEVLSLKARGDYGSFKISAPASVAGLLFSADSWPAGVHFGRFRDWRNNTKSNINSTSTTSNTTSSPSVSQLNPSVAVSPNVTFADVCSGAAGSMTPTVNTLSTTNAKSGDTTMSTVASSTISSVPQCRDSTVTVLPSSSSSVLSPLRSALDGCFSIDRLVSAPGFTVPESTGISRSRYVGFMTVNKSVIMLKDLEVIKQTTIKNFDNFASHAAHIDDNFDPIIGRNLLFITGNEWKDMRATLSPTFTSSKLRNMMALVDETGKQIVDFYSGKMNEPENKDRGLIEVEMGDVLSRYTNDVIASTVFGVTVDSLNERHNEFYNMGIKTFDLSGIQQLKLVVYFSFPFLIRISGVQFLPKKLSDFFRNLVLGTMKYREKNGINRPDMIQMLMEARKGSLKYDVSHNEGNDAGFATVVESAIGKQTNKRNWTENDIVAQAVIFFIAGYETTKTLLSFAIHELTVNPDVQKRLQIEIDELIAEKGDALDYSNLMQMKYMDMVVCEALRKWPPVPGTDRKCIRAFKLPPPNNSTNEEFTIRAGEAILVPIYAIHRDPQYYPDPEKFDPERFSTENKTNINPLSFLPFGVGPRNCIGSRYALMITKSIIFRLLSKFDLVMTAKTQNPIKIDNNSLSIIPKNGVWTGLKPRNELNLNYKLIKQNCISGNHFPPDNSRWSVDFAYILFHSNLQLISIKNQRWKNMMDYPIHTITDFKKTCIQSNKNATPSSTECFNTKVEKVLLNDLVWEDEYSETDPLPNNDDENNETQSNIVPANSQSFADMVPANSQ